MKLRSSLVSLIATGVLVACSNSSPSGNQDPIGSSAEALSSVNVFHSTQTGGDASGSVSHYDFATGSYYGLQFQAWENNSAQSRTASLSVYGYGYTSTQVCYDELICQAWNYPAGCTSYEDVQYCYEQEVPYWISGFGNIPTSDFRVGPHTAHLTTDLANDPGFTLMRCGYDQNWNFACTPVTGTFDVTWRDNGSFSTEQQGTWKMTSSSPWGSFTMQSTGHASKVAANASGTVLGDSVDTWGSVGQSMGASVTRDVFQGSSGGDAGAPPP